MSDVGFTSNPAPESCRLIDFESFDVNPGFVPDTWFLTVRGTTPCVNMKVMLTPLIYVTCPEYWGIEVVGCLPGGYCLTALGHFEETISLNGLIGSSGIEVIGAKKREQYKVSGGCGADVKFAR